MTFGVFPPPFRPAFAHSAAAGNGLLNALIAYWPGDEASGNMLDAHVNGLTLSPVNTPTSATGHVYSLARNYTSYAGHYRADSILLSTGDIDFALAAWFKMVTAIGGGNGIISKWGAAANREYSIYVSSGNSTRFDVSPDGTLLVSSPSAALSLGVWHLLVAWHDSMADTINFQVDNSTVLTTNHAGGVYDSGARFDLAQRSTANWNLCHIGPVAFWKSAAGGGGVLTAAQRTALYNAGAGLAYSAFTA